MRYSGGIMVRRGWGAVAVATAGWSAAWLAGCGPSAHRTGGAAADGAAEARLAPATAGEACQQINEAAARLAARCSGGSLDDWRAYESATLDCAAYDRHVAEGLVEYLPAGFATC